MSSLQRILPGAAGGALYDSVASRRIEAEALAGSAEHVLMQRAGQAVVQLALALAPHARRIHVACGPGNNGGDGLVAATLLHGLGKTVEMAWLGDTATVSGDAAWALSVARQAGLSIAAQAAGAAPDLAIDALLGLGGTRAPGGALLDAILRLNALACPRLAVDLPSGLCGDTGRLHGSHAVQASASLSLLTLKPGLFTGQGRDHAGEVWFADLGASAHALQAAPPTARLGDGAAARRLFSPRHHAAHKGSFGDLWVLGGDHGMTGAAVLAARAGLLAGAGRVLVNLLAATGDAGPPSHDALRPELMQRDRAAWQAAGVLEAATLVCGCGGGLAVASVLAEALRRAARLVLDADALNAIAAEPTLAEQLARRGREGRPTVLTPHPLEAARLLGCPTAQIQQDRLAAAQALSGRFGAVVVLKGSGTVVSAPSALAVVNPSGNARLATAGSGDVLAGWLGGLWSRHPAGPVPMEAARQAAEAAVWLHGRAAEIDAPATRAGLPLPASDLLAALPRAVLAS